MRYESLVDTETLAAHLDDPDWVVIDCRFSLARPALGEQLYREAHIRGTLFADLEKDLSGPVTPRTGRHPLPDPKALTGRLGNWGIGPDNLAGPGRFLAPDVLRRRFVGKLGGRLPQDVVHMCGSGVSAIHNILAMEVAGLHGSRLYPGSWSEWIRSANRPVARGAEGLPGTLI